VPAAGLAGEDDDGQEYLECQFGITEHAAVTVQVAAARPGRAAGMGMPFSEPDAAVGVVRKIGEGLGMRNVAAETGRQADGARPGIARVDDVQYGLGTVAVVAQEDTAGLPAVLGRGSVPQDGRPAGVGDRDNYRAARVLRLCRTLAVAVGLGGNHRVLPGEMRAMLSELIC